MNIIMLGPQGCGKGTQAKKLASELNIPHISTGDIFREIRKQDSELGRKVKDLIDNGNLVPDDVTIRIVEDRLSKEDCANGYILDGFPRTLPQAESLDKIAKIDYAIDIEIPDEDVVYRLEGRRTCSNKECGIIYNINTAPKPKDSTKCDKCSSELLQRNDDKAESIKKRLEAYHSQTQPLIKFYKNKGVLVEIDGTKSIDEVSSSIQQKIN